MDTITPLIIHFHIDHLQNMSMPPQRPGLDKLVGGWDLDGV